SPALVRDGPVRTEAPVALGDDQRASLDGAGDCDVGGGKKTHKKPSLVVSGAKRRNFDPIPVVHFGLPVSGKSTGPNNNCPIRLRTVSTSHTEAGCCTHIGHSGHSVCRERHSSH